MFKVKFYFFKVLFMTVVRRVNFIIPINVQYEKNCGIGAMVCIPSRTNGGATLSPIIAENAIGIAMVL